MGDEAREQFDLRMGQGVPKVDFGLFEERPLSDCLQGGFGKSNDSFVVVVVSFAQEGGIYHTDVLEILGIRDKQSWIRAKDLDQISLLDVSLTLVDVQWQF